MKKKNKNNITAFPFANPIKQMKEEFKHTIDIMPDEDFVSMIHFLAESDLDEDFNDNFDEEFGDETDEDFVLTKKLWDKYVTDYYAAFKGKSC